MKDWLARATDGGRLKCFELLPYVRRLMHDTPGISGDSPHKLVFNRDRHMAGVPYEGTEGAEAGEWFDCVTKFEQEIRGEGGGLAPGTHGPVEQLAFGRTSVPFGGHGLVPTAGGAECCFAPKLGGSTSGGGERGRGQLPFVDGAT